MSRTGDDRQIEGIEVVGDRTADVGPDEGFLRFRRLTVRNRYGDGSTSAPYACDIVSRQRVDAVAVVLYDIDDQGVVRVALKEGVRPPVYLRRDKQIPHGDVGDQLLVAEIPAGMLEPEDDGEGGIERRAALECMEEAGARVDPSNVAPLGAPMFASPGMADEMVHYRMARADLDALVTPTGDGSVMEEAGGVILLSLDEAIARCRDGRIPDAKTELALVRLRDLL